ncbi:MAG: NAD(P)-dependent oxidoreductase [Asgard group archaeon]|nr:NAD(P)-dependent oxidoreductase [Asgard group archaeon]
MSKKRAFITGANGYIGSYLTKYLAEKDIETIAYILKGTDCDFLKMIYPSLKNVKIIEGNVLDNSSLQNEIKGSNYVIHLAGVIKGYTQEECDKINVKGTKNLLDACVKVNPGVDRVVLISSSAAGGYGTPEDPLTEDKELKPFPKDFYGVSKYKMEIVSKAYKKSLPISIVRPCAVAGPGNNVTLDYYSLTKMGVKMVFNGPRKEVSLVDIDDLIYGIYLCAIKQEAIGEAFYFSCDGSVTINEMQEIINYKIFGRKYGSLLSLPVSRFLMKTVAIILEVICKLQKKPIHFINLSKVNGAFAPGHVVSSDKAKRLLGWKPEQTIVSLIDREGKWFKDQGLI